MRTDSVGVLGCPGQPRSGPARRLETPNPFGRPKEFGRPSSPAGSLVGTERTSDSDVGFTCRRLGPVPRPFDPPPRFGRDADGGTRRGAGPRPGRLLRLGGLHADSGGARSGGAPDPRGELGVPPRPSGARGGAAPS